MSEVAENEVVVIFHPTNVPKMQHAHHGREVICKAGATSVTLGPTHSVGPDTFGHDVPNRYVRTEEVDELGRAVFKQAALVE